MDSVQVCKIQLGTEILRSGRPIRIGVWGTSMLPAVWPGDIISVHPCSSAQLLAGDIILCRDHDRYLAHRFIELAQIEGRYYVSTQGDAIPDKDPLFHESSVLGRVYNIHRGDRVMVPSRHALHARAIGYLLSHLDRLRSICLRVHVWRTSSELVGVTK